MTEVNLEEEVSVLTNQVADLENQVQSKDQQIKAQSERIGLLSAQINDLDVDKQALMDEVTDAREEGRRLRKLATQRGREMDKAVKLIETLQNSVKALGAKIDELKANQDASKDPEDAEA